jgi:hypothetical protein
MKQQRKLTDEVLSRWSKKCKTREIRNKVGKINNDAMLCWPTKTIRKKKF